MITRTRPAAPIRILHLGAGAFFKAHQAWYTAIVDKDNEWGIAAFSGRSSQTIDELNRQDCIYTLIQRDAQSESIQQIESISAAYDGAQEKEFSLLFAKPELAIVTLTITEAGYRLNNQGVIDLTDNVVSKDLEKLSNNEFPTSTLCRLAYGLKVRFLEQAGSIAIVPCDNFPNNGPLVEKALKKIFLQFGDQASEWLEKNVSFVSTSVDRITPKISEIELTYVHEVLDLHDRTPVVTEKFSDWILEGEFPNGRPQWEEAGAKFVAEIKNFESRKLWLLNGAHSLIAYQGLNNGFTTVDQAIQDPEILLAVTQWWDEVEKVLTNPNLDIANYRKALLERFRNPNIAHQLAQIAIDGSTKLALRVKPVAQEISRPTAAAHIVAQWVTWISKQEVIPDTRAHELLPIKNSPKKLVAILDSSLADGEFMELVNKELKTISV